MLGSVKDRCPRLKVVWADGIYEERWLIDWVRTEWGWELTITKRSDKEKGFQVVPKRWVVERTFAGRGRYHRLSEDYEKFPKTSEALIPMAMIPIMVRRLEPTHQDYLASQTEGVEASQAAQVSKSPLRRTRGTDRCGNDQPTVLAPSRV